MADYSKELLEKTISVWQTYSPKPLSLEDARQIIETTTDLFSFLLELEQKYGEKEKKNL